MNRQIRQLGVALLVLFALLFARLNVVQVFDADELTADPLNTRRVVRDFGQRRGQIVTADGVLVAESVDVDGRFARERRYPLGSDYAHVTGYFSFEFGATGVERTYNDELAGRTDTQRFESFLDVFGDGDVSGDIHLTIDSELQRAAINALGQRNGSVIALDPATGAVLAFHSWPSFDPNTVSTVDLDAARAAKEALDDDEAVPLLTRAHREVFAPGSTFKVVTAASALEFGRVTPTAPVFPELVEYELPLTEVTLQNFGGNPCGGDLSESLARSCNTSFAEIGAEYLGPELMIDTAERFGFNDDPPFDVPLAATSRFPTDYGIVLGQSDTSPPADIVEGSSLLAQASIGQYDVRATPLQMALVAAGVANGGEIMQPHVVDRVTDSDGGEVIDRVEPELWRRAVSPSVADATAEMMVGVVERGTAVALARPGLTVGAKTGTAEVSETSVTEDSHAWVIAFAGPTGGSAEIAIAVMVEAVPGGGQQTGSGVAGPVAAAVLDAHFG
ncbi:MAG: penicillin-binding transpeptidase domain-containing protein [Actinomycetota bacterium]